MPFLLVAICSESIRIGMRWMRDAIKASIIHLISSISAQLRSFENTMRALLCTPFRFFLLASCLSTRVRVYPFVESKDRKHANVVFGWIFMIKTTKIKFGHFSAHHLAAGCDLHFSFTPNSNALHALAVPATTVAGNVLNGNANIYYWTTKMWSDISLLIDPRKKIVKSFSASEKRWTNQQGEGISSSNHNSFADDNIRYTW